MKVSLEWINDFVDIKDVDVPNLYKKFTLQTAEVEEMIVKDAHLKTITIVEIKSIRPHPEADKLNLVTILLDNKGGTKEVVCGASNVKLGIKVPYAALGTVLPSGLKLEGKKIRGILSEGMLCSEEELGMKETSDGLLLLPENAVVGMSIGEFFKKTTTIIFDIDNKSLTHRPDLWGHYGMAREFSVMFNRPLKAMYGHDWCELVKKNISERRIKKNTQAINVQVEGESALKGFMGITLSNINNKISLPNYISDRILAAGLRPINPLVDISNYVMLETGHPLHIYDRNKIQGETLYIKKSSLGDFETLDGVQRPLIDSDTIIADVNGPLVLAGIMGGTRAMVDENTTDIFIEVANWNPALVRKTSVRLGLRSDSSQRFEKNLDQYFIEKTLLRTVEMIFHFYPAAEVVGDLLSTGYTLPENLIIDINPKLICDTLGVELKLDAIVDILNRLDFKTSLTSNNNLSVVVPSYRSTKDVTEKVDLIEEIGRVIGFDNIKPIAPSDTIAPLPIDDRLKLWRQIRDFISLKVYAFEVMTYPLIGQELLQKVGWEQDRIDNHLKVLNPVSKDKSLLRESMIPNIIETIEINAKSSDRFRFFEIGRTYEKGKAQFSEEKSILSLAFYDREVNQFTNVFNHINELCSLLNYNVAFDEAKEINSSILPFKWSAIHPYECVNLRIQGKICGAIFSLHPYWIKKWKIKGHASIALIDFTSLQNLSNKNKKNIYKSLPKFPSSYFDWTVECEHSDSIYQLIKICKKIKRSEIESIDVLDIYRAEKKYVTLRAVLYNAEKTLSASEIKEISETLVENTEKNGFKLKK